MAWKKMDIINIWRTFINWQDENPSRKLESVTEHFTKYEYNKLAHMKKICVNWLEGTC